MLPTNESTLSNRSLTRDILRDQEEHRRASLLRPFATLFHLLQELYDFSSCFFCHVQGNFRMESVASHSCFCIVQSGCFFFSRSHSFSLGKASSNFFNSSFSKVCPPHFAHFRHTASALPILSSLPQNDLTTSRLLFLSSVSALFLSTLLASLSCGEVMHCLLRS